MAKLWKGRFEKEISGFADEWGSSINFDKTLYRQDITGSLVHCRMLCAQGIITAEDADKIEKTLHDILNEIEAGTLKIDDSYEDIHMAVEAILTDRIGDAGKKLHTARSRNDQVATDIRLWLKEEIILIKELLKELRLGLVGRAKEEIDTIMPGYTHLQHAQPVRLAFHLLVYYQMFTRDSARLDDVFKRTDIMPLGSGALAGTSYDTDRESLAEGLGFAGISPNAMDAVSDRDFAIEFLSAASMIMMHLSRFAKS